MLELPRDFLYQLLPAFYRVQDQQIGQPLRALMTTVEQEYRAIHQNVQELYDGWFIETCAPWMVPYLAELLGVEGLVGWESELKSARLRVANALAMRRRKGTARGLELAAAAFTGWPAQVVVPGAEPEVSPAGAKVRLWRLRTFPVRTGNACRLPSGVFTFHPLGVDTPLFHVPSPALFSDDPVTPENLPVRLTRDILRREIAALREGRTPPSHFFSSPSAPQVWDPETERLIPPEAMEVASLADGPSALSECDSTVPVRLFLDPETGRFAFPGVRESARPLRVSYAYALSADLGGGPYFLPSPPSPEAAASAEEWQAILGPREGSTEGGVWVFTTLLAALYAWIATGRRRAVVWLAGDGTWDLARDGLEIVLPAGYRLTLRAMAGYRPVLLGNLELEAWGGPASVALEGLWLGGRLALRGEVELSLAHVTLAPGADPAGSVVIEAEAGDGASTAARVSLEHCITGPVSLLGGRCLLRVADSILDGVGGDAVVVAHAGAQLRARLARTTVLGRSRFSVLEEAEDVLFAEQVVVMEPEAGEVRNSYVPAGSERSRCGHCMPPPGKELKLVFRSRRYGAGAYAQLSTRTSREIRVGSSRGSEIGVFERLRNAGRQAALGRVFKEQLPWGVSAQGAFVT